MYTKLTYKPLWTLKSGQDGTIWGDFIFRFNGRGDCQVFTLSNRQYFASFTLDQTDLFSPHSNAVAFGAERWEENDEFPLLYTNLYNNYAKAEDRREGVCCVYRITREDKTFSTKLVQVLRIGFVDDRALWKSQDDESDVRPYGNFVVDAGAKKLYAFVMRDRDRLTRYFEFDLPTLADGEICEKCGAKVVTLKKEDILAQFDGAYANYIQGACCRDGIIYSVEGFNVTCANPETPNRPRLQVMDAKSRTQIGDFDLADMGLLMEPEFIEWAGDTLIYSDARGNYFSFVLE
ncbi:MAG: hypothetical protein E7463_13365 [Ruminococcaceae bacterium]|nr:hypothetical protein [Oscillospiraceae bacterium]